MNTASTASASIAYFERVPNEVLHLILSFVIIQGVLDPHPNFECHQLFVLRWVSRRFRMITNQLEIWHADEFNDEFAYIFNCGRSNCLKEAQFLRILLNDPELGRSLSRRTCWEFENIDLFYTIITSIPEVNQKTTNVTLLEFPIGLNVVIDRLEQFTCLTK